MIKRALFLIFFLTIVQDVHAFGLPTSNSKQFKIFAGKLGGPGYRDGSSVIARFKTPLQVAFDSSGNAYIADSGNYVIRKVTPGGVVSTLAGTQGAFGSTDGTGAAARFGIRTGGIAVDPSDNVYVTDYSNHTIRKITPAGVVTTFVGLAASAGNANGTGSAARFTNPNGIASDSVGNLYVADAGNHRIRKVTPGGVVTTLAGSSLGNTDGTGAAAQFFFPFAIALDSVGNSYVTEINNTIRKITPAGVVTTMAGAFLSSGSTDGTGSAALFRNPSGIIVDASGNLFVSDTTNNTIRKITPAKVVTTFSGVAGTVGSIDGTGSAARFNSPQGLAIDSSGNIYVAEVGSHNIRKITPAGLVTTFLGVPEHYGTTNGTGISARFYSPGGGAVDSSGNIYVADTFNHMIRKVTPTGVVTTLAGTAGTSGYADGTGTSATFNSPTGIAIDSSGNLFVTDFGNATIRKITSGGVVTTFAGSAGVTGLDDGTGSAARFYRPSGITIDASNNLYVADLTAHSIRKITPAAVVTTLAGTGLSLGSADGTGSAARFSSPTGIAVDSSGNVYVGDTNNHTIRKITSAGVVTTLAGTAGSSGSTNGTGSAARFYSPANLSIDSSGNIFVIDSANCLIRKVTSAGVVTRVAGKVGECQVILGPTKSASLSTGAQVLFRKERMYVITESGIILVPKPW